MRKVYFDNAATTQPHPKVVEAMHPILLRPLAIPESALIWPAGKKAIRGKGKDSKTHKCKAFRDHLYIHRHRGK